MTIESISTGGARLVGPLTLDRGERVQILFEVEGRPVEVGGEVVRVESRDMATDRVSVRFVDVDDNTAELIRGLVQRTLELEERQRESEFEAGHDGDA